MGLPDAEDRLSIGRTVAKLLTSQKRREGRAGPGRVGSGRAAHTDIFPLKWKELARSLRSLAR